jgi:hypothetical protein
LNFAIIASRTRPVAFSRSLNSSNTAGMLTPKECEFKFALGEFIIASRTRPVALSRSLNSSNTAGMLNPKECEFNFARVNSSSRRAPVRSPSAAA